MTIKVPMFCLSHSIRGTCTIRVTDGVASDDVTIPEGRYWTDFVYGSDLETVASPCLMGRLLYLIQSGTAVGGALTKAYSVGTSPYVHVRSQFSDDGGGTGLTITDGGHANTTTEGRRALRRMGLPQLGQSEPWDSSTTMGIMQGIWSPNQAEYGSLRDPTRNNSVTNRAWDGTAWTLNVGGKQSDRLVLLSGVPGPIIWKRGQVDYPYENATSSDYSMQTLFMDAAERGEYIRMYEDRTATKTYLTAALSSTATSASVASGSGISNGDIIWIDGEEVFVSSGGGTTTLVLERDKPEAHSIYAPISKDRVATYALAEDAIQVFQPSKRHVSADFWDVEIALARTVF